MVRFCVMALAACLAACAPQVNGTELGGSAQWYGPDNAGAVSAANTHCQRYGRTARVNQVDSWGGYIAFSCERS